MNPDTSDVHVNSLLTNISIGYAQQESNFIADRVFPVIMVDKQSDFYATYDKDAWFRDFGDRMRRAPGDRAALSGWTINASNTYYCQNEAIGTFIPDELRMNADSVFQLDADATRFVTNAQLIRRERMFAADFMKTGVWGSDKIGGTNFTKWSDYSSSNPMLDIEAWKNEIRTKIGRYPNKLVLGELAWRRLKNHPVVVDRIKGGATADSPALVTRQLIASWFELDEVLVELASYNSAPEGAAVNLVDVFSDSGLLLYVSPNPGMLTPSAGYTFVWRPAVNGQAIQYIRKYREEPYKRDVFESHSYLDQVVTAADAGIFLSDIAD